MILENSEGKFMKRKGSFNMQQQRQSVPYLYVLVALLIGVLLPRPNFMERRGGKDDLTSIDTVVDNSSGRSKDDGGGSTGVLVEFYGESECPDCKHMVLDVLDPLFENGVSKLFDLKYIAYGKVRGEPGKSIECQHGEVECTFNRYINCAQSKDGGGSRDQNVWFPFVKCLAQYITQMEAKLETCSEKSGLSSDKLSECVQGKQGDRLEERAGLETIKLKPTLKFVPWIVVQGVPLGADFENLERYVCALSPEDARPPACNELPKSLQHM